MIFVFRAAFYACLSQCSDHSTGVYMQVMYAPDEPQLFRLREKWYENGAGSGISPVYL